MAAVITGSEYWSRTTSLWTTCRSGSVCAWVKLANTPGYRDYLFDVQQDASNLAQLYMNTSRQPTIWNNFGGETSASSGLTNGVWTHIGITGEGEIVVDGTQVVNQGSGGFGAPTVFRLGSNGTDGFDGKIAYVRSWDAVLTASEFDAERTSTTAVKSGVQFDHPFIGSAGSGWTATGTPTFDSDDPLAASVSGAIRLLLLGVG